MHHLLPRGRLFLGVIGTLHQPSWLWEGVTYYLTDGVIEATFARIASCDCAVVASSACCRLSHHYTSGMSSQHQECPFARAKHAPGTAWRTSRAEAAAKLRLQDAWNTAARYPRWQARLIVKEMASAFLRYRMPYYITEVSQFVHSFPCSSVTHKLSITYGLLAFSSFL